MPVGSGYACTQVVYGQVYRQASYIFTRGEAGMIQLHSLSSGVRGKQKRVQVCIQDMYGKTWKPLQQRRHISSSVKEAPGSRAVLDCSEPSETRQATERVLPVKM